MINKGIIIGAVLASVWPALVAAGPAYAIGGVMPGLRNTPGVTLARHMGPGIGAGIHVGGHHIAMHNGPFLGTTIAISGTSDFWSAAPITTTIMVGTVAGGCATEWS